VDLPPLLAQFWEPTLGKNYLNNFFALLMFKAAVIAIQVDEIDYAAVCFFAGFYEILSVITLQRRLQSVFLITVTIAALAMLDTLDVIAAFVVLSCCAASVVV